MLAALALVFAPLSVWAQDAVPNKILFDEPNFSVVTENDAFFSGTDRNYTNGLKFNYTLPDRKTPDFAKKIGRTLLRSKEGQPLLSTFVFGQSIYTPEDISSAAPLPDQHPYAGWLYLGSTITSVKDKHADVLSLELGVVGPAAKGEFVQSNFHQLIDGQEPKGWDNQLKNELGLLLSYQHHWTSITLPQLGPFEFDVTPTLGASLGNVQISGTAGLGFRIGGNLNSDPFGPPRIRPAISGPGTFGSDKFSWYFFVNTNARAVGRDIFLDGNTFRHSQSVDKQSLVGEVQAGLALQVHCLEFTYSLINRTEQFEGQDDAQRFGVVSLAIRL